MGDMLSQDEIDALLGGGDDDETEASVSTEDNDGSFEFDNNATTMTVDDFLTEEQKDILGEVGNISMGTSATTLFALLGQKVSINTPKVRVMNWGILSQEQTRPCVGVRVDYKEGLRGSNILVLKQHDVKVIASLMMGGDGQVGEDEELTDLDLSAIGEAMNQMVGSSATSLSSLTKMKIDINTPEALKLNFKDDTFFNTIGYGPDEVIVCVSFKMTIGELVDSEIMQILPKEFAIDMVENLKSDVIGNKKAAPAPEAAPVPPPEPAAQPYPPVPIPSPYPQTPPIPPGYDYYQQPQQPMPAYMPPPPQQNVNVRPVQFQNFDPSAVMQQKENIDIIMDVRLDVTVELGRTTKKIKDILEFVPGTIIELDKLAGEPIDILVNGKFVAKGEVVVIDENFGIRITDIISPEKRITM
jgi:flagellar motor switch protein FliN/FliY